MEESNAGKFNASLDEALDTAFDVHQDDTEEGIVSKVIPTPEALTEPQEPQAPVRDVTGKFQKKGQVQESVQEPEQPSLDPPQFWKAEKKALFAKAPRDVQEAILEHESQRVAWANQIADKYLPANKRYAELDETFKPYERQWAREGLRPSEVVKRLVTWQEDFDNEETRIESLNRLLASYDLTPQDLMTQGQNPYVEQGQPGYYDPRIDTLQNEIMSLREELETKEQNTVLENTQQEINAWMLEKDENGTLLRPQAGFYEPQIAEAVQHLMQQCPGRATREYLDTAHQMLLQHLGQASPQAPVSQDKIAEAKKRQAQARNASSSIKGSPDAASARQKPKGIDEALEMAFEIHGG